MQGQYDNQVLSSFLLFIEHEIVKEGVAFTNTNSLYYDVTDEYSNYYTYSSPYRPTVSDISINNINSGTNNLNLTGIYLNNSYIGIGQSGLVDINHAKNEAYFTSPINGTLSGNFSLGEYTFSLTNQPEANLLFETKYALRPKINQTLTGLDSNTLTYPIVFIRSNGGQNKPFAFGGEDLSENNIRAVILTDSQFSLDATLSILKDTKFKYVPLLDTNEFPYNYLGGYYTGKIYDYSSLTATKVSDGEALFIENSYASPYNQVVKVDVTNSPAGIYCGFCEFSLSKNRFPRA